MRLLGDRDAEAVRARLASLAEPDVLAAVMQSATT